MVDVLDPTVLTNFRNGLFGVSDEDDGIYLVEFGNDPTWAIPLSGTRGLTSLDLDQITPIGADWVSAQGLFTRPLSTPDTVGETTYDGRLAGVHHGETQRMYIDLGMSLKRASRPIDFDFRIASSLDPRITFTRAGSGTYFNSSGVMQTAGTNVPRLNHRYNGSTWEPVGLLIEGAATNLLLRSREFDNASWAKGDTTITANAANGVGGDATMDLCTEGTAGNASLRQTATIVANSTNTIAIDLKRGNHDWVVVTIYETAAPTNTFRGWFNLNTGTVGSATNGGTASGATAAIRNLGNGIYRCILTGAVNNSATAVTCATFAASADASTTRVNNGERYQDRAQLEAGSVATSFILTEGSTQNRAADVAVITGSNFSSWFNPTEGTFVVECDSAAAPSSNVCPFSVSDGTNSNRMHTNAFSTASWYVYTSGAAQASITTTSPAADTVFKRAMAYKTDDFAISHNGASAVTDTSGAVPTGLNRLGLGNLNGSGSPLSGHIRSLRYFPQRLSDAQLVALSTL